MRAVLIQQIYPHRGFLQLIQDQFKRNTEYCQKFDIDYRFFMEEKHDALLGGWDKLFYIQDALEYDLIVWLDADAILYNTSVSVKDIILPEDSFGAVKFKIPVQHYNVGVLYLKPGIRTVEFLSKWIESFPGAGAWHEQSVFNNMANECVVELPQTWNRNYDNNPFANPVVMGFHGFGTPENRLALMNKVLNGTQRPAL